MFVFTSSVNFLFLHEGAHTVKTNLIIQILSIQSIKKKIKSKEKQINKLVAHDLYQFSDIFYGYLSKGLDNLILRRKGGMT